MSIFSRSAFPGSKSGSTALSQVRDGAPSELVREAVATGGYRAGWRIRRAVDAESAALVAEAVKAHFAARRDEMIFRTHLLRDSAMKRAVAEQMADAAVTEREIVRMTDDVIRDLTLGRLDNSRQASLEETRRVRELSAALERGEITQRRFETECRRIEAATDDICDKAEAVCARVIANLGERLEAALREGYRPRQT